MVYDITVAMTTWFPSGEEGTKRLAIAKQALASWEVFLYNKVGKVYLHIADDGSDPDLVEELMDSCIDYEPTVSSQQRHGVGASLNSGFRKAFERSDFVLYAVDDWALNYQFDLTPWIKLLEEREDIGAVRLGPPHPDLTGIVVHDDNRWFLRLDRHHFAFSLRPTLFHKRMMERYGQFSENVNSYDVERMYSKRFNDLEGPPEIVYAMPYPWDHIYGVELAGVNPREG